MCKQVSEQMAEPGADMDALMTRMDRLQTQIEAADGWELERQLERAMDALRCPPGKHSTPHCSSMPSLCLPGCVPELKQIIAAVHEVTQPWRLGFTVKALACIAAVASAHDELLLA